MGREDFTRIEDVDKSFQDQFKARKDNKNIVEKQNINIFEHKGYENALN